MNHFPPIDCHYDKRWCGIRPTLYGLEIMVKIEIDCSCASLIILRITYRIKKVSTLMAKFGVQTRMFHGRSWVRNVIEILACPHGSIVSTVYNSWKLLTVKSQHNWTIDFLICFCLPSHSLSCSCIGHWGLVQVRSIEEYTVIKT